MRFLIFTTIFFCLSTFISFAQQKEIILTGTLKMNTGETFPYKVALTETDGVVKGYSLTYNAPDDTKATITGTLDRHNRTLSFRETEIQYSHTVHTKAYMCLINASLEYVQGSNGKVLTGRITGAEADKTACTGGKITFNNADEIENLFSYHDKFDTVISMKRRVKAAPDAKPDYNEAKPVVVQPLVTDKITAGVEKTYDWHSDTVVIDIWDGGNVDGDKITLEFNGKPYLTNYYLVKEKKQLRLPLSGGVNTISILAVNEGSDPPNTADLLLTDGTLKYSILAYNPKGMKSVIKIKKVAK